MQNVIERRDLDKRADKECNLDNLFALIRSFGQGLQNHMNDEAIQDQKVLSAIDKLDKRLDSMEEKVDSLMVLQMAFPETEEGIPDIHGHKHDHTTRMKAYQTSTARWNKWKEKWIEKAMDGAILAAMLLLGYGVIGWLQATTNVVVK